MSNDRDLLSVVSGEGIDFDKLLLILFKDYEKKKKSGNLYSIKDFDPQGLIKVYYRTTDDPKFAGLMSNFRRKYIQNESQLESVHEKCERDGLGEIYDYIQSHILIQNINVFAILKLHELLFSHAPYPEFGGKFRNQDVYLPGAGVETEVWDNIPRAIGSLYESTNQLVQVGIKLGKEKDINAVIPYIDKCIELNAEIIRIHPFMDGNGRVARALLNIMFKLANIPFVYVRPKERLEYEQAMNKAINEKDFSTLKRFYYYKICDSIFELDIQERLKMETIEKSKTR